MNPDYIYTKTVVVECFALLIGVVLWLIMREQHRKSPHALSEQQRAGCIAAGFAAGWNTCAGKAATEDNGPSCVATLTLDHGALHPVGPLLPSGFADGDRVYIVRIEKKSSRSEGTS